MKNHYSFENMARSFQPLSSNRFYPELDYFMNESKCDVVFIVDCQRLPVQKSLLMIKNNVFRAMFSNNFKESKDKEIVIKDTTFDAFKRFIWFLYSEQLVIEDSNDLNLIEEIIKLSDRYEANRLMNNLCQFLSGKQLTFNNFEQISRIAFRYKMEELMSKVMDFIDKHFDKFMIKNEQELKQLNESTDGRLLKVMSNNYRKVNKELNDIKVGSSVENQGAKYLCSSCKSHQRNTSSYCIGCGNYAPGLPRGHYGLGSFFGGHIGSH